MSLSPRRKIGFVVFTSRCGVYILITEGERAGIFDQPKGLKYNYKENDKYKKCRKGIVM